MFIGINPERAPLAKYKSGHLQQIKYRELEQRLIERGIEITGGGEQSITVSLKNLLEANGTGPRAKVALMETLRELGADAVTFEAQDASYIDRDVFSHVIGRAIESGVEPVVDLLSDIPIDEDPDNPTIDIFGRLDQAAEFCIADRHPDADVRERLQNGAAQDLVNWGLLEPGRRDYGDWMDAAPDEAPPPLPYDFQTSVQPYRSAFDDGDF